jgi:hypothetical protein
MRRRRRAATWRSPTRPDRPDATKDLFEASIAVAYLKVDDKAGLDAR